MLTFFRRMRKGLLGTGATRKPATQAGTCFMISGRFDTLEENIDQLVGAIFGLKRDEYIK